MAGGSFNHTWTFNITLLAVGLSGGKSAINNPPTLSWHVEEGRTTEGDKNKSCSFIRWETQSDKMLQQSAQTKNCFHSHVNNTAFALFLISTIYTSLPNFYTDQNGLTMHNQPIIVHLMRRLSCRFIKKKNRCSSLFPSGTVDTNILNIFLRLQSKYQFSGNFTTPQ